MQTIAINLLLVPMFGSVDDAFRLASLNVRLLRTHREDIASDW